MIKRRLSFLSMKCILVQEKEEILQEFFKDATKRRGERVLKNTKLSCLNPTAHGLFQQKIIDFNA